MHFYRSINKIQAITFDLDDTLYDNGPFLARSEVAHIETIQQFDGLQNVTQNEYKSVKNSLLLENPEIYHDVVDWRAQATVKLLALRGLKDKSQIQKITDEAMHNFTLWRNKVIVPQASIDVLAKLAEKLPLAVITNGNADINLIGLKEYFQFSLRGGPDGLSKPYPDMFQRAAKQLNKPEKNILHIGDHLIYDVAGSINAGMQACWINLFDVNIYQNHETRVLPHIEISALSELNNLI